MLIQQRLVTEQQTVAFGFAADAQPAQRAEIIYRRQALVYGFVEDGARQRVTGALLQRRRQAQSGGFIHSGKGFYRHHLRFTLGEGTGFIKDQRIEGAGALQRIGVAHQYPELRCAAHA